MIRLFSAPLLNGHPLTPRHTVEVEHTTRTDIGIMDISTHTHLVFEAVCNEDDEAHYRELMLNQLKASAHHWECHYDAVASALRHLQA